MRVLSILAIPVGLIGVNFSLSFLISLSSVAQTMMSVETDYLSWLPEGYNSPVEYANGIVAMQMYCLAGLLLVSLGFMVGGILVLLRRKAGLWILRGASLGTILCYVIYLYFSNHYYSALPGGISLGIVGQGMVWIVTVLGGFLCVFPLIVFIVCLFPPPDYFMRKAASPQAPPQSNQF